MAATDEDVLLSKVILAYKIEAYVPAPLRFGPKEKLGQALFFDPFVSGPKKIACAACHVRSKGSADGLPLAVGLGSSGVGAERLHAGDAFVIPRNALPFFNRGTAEFRALFWDGRVQLGNSGTIESPLGSKLPNGFDNLLAAAAVFPLVEPDEMLGRSEWRGATSVTYHAELAEGIPDPDNYEERSLRVFRTLMRRLLGDNTGHRSNVQESYRILVQDAYPGTPIESINITHVGNALAAYITSAFALKQAQWDHYVQGNVKALTPSQKQGAMIFFGKGRCFVCHTGTQFSDFSFHGLAVPQLNVGKHGRHVDYGRAAATSRAEDRFHFRTPPLRNVEITGPWGHNGVFLSLSEVIDHHVNPVPLLYAAQMSSAEEARMSGRLLGQRSDILPEIGLLTDKDVELLVDFLSALTSETLMSSRDAIPRSVPSGITDFIRE